jgi:hypothetical protein
MINSKEQEDTITTEIEKQTVKIPSDVFLFSAIGAIGISFGLRCFNKKNEAAFVGQWVAPILLLGVYNKLVKQAK